MIDVEEIYMRRALQLARLGEGSVSPNPMVGAVIVHSGKIIGEGYHRKFGTAHAEVNAIAAVANKSLLKDSTLYVTLEPCSHYGKTPPCSKLIINDEIPRVVVGCLDPYAKVSGRGVAMLREAGVKVTLGVLENECRAVNEHFMTAHTLQRPFVILKWAQSADGYIDSTRNDCGSQVIFSNAVTTMWTHRERAECDAIMVGSNTVITDNPSLTVRNWVGRNPIRVVIDRQDVVPNDSRLLSDGGKTIIFSTQESHKSGSVEYIAIDQYNDVLLQVLKELYSRNITSLMVEGGAKLLNAFIKSELWDIARIEKSPAVLDDGVAAPIITGEVTKVEIHGDNVIEFMKCS
ncbi:MAG: bifunctional diaminohydroxyphosphoribosylaminopyrimidine deaminase/5-amino-6-(5-phosphoribosylamino)uracil reductase RibD [Muribaculaceae bacterium]